MRSGVSEAGSDHRTALLVVDLQQALCDAAPAEAIKNVVARITELLDWAVAHFWPVVFVQHWTEPGTILHRGSAGWQLNQAVRGYSRAFHLEKNVLSCFEDGQLQTWLEEHDVRRICVTGMQTEYCVSAACEGAAGRGYQVILPVDAHMTIDRPEKSAAQIVAETNDRLSSFADCRPTASIVTSTYS